MSKSFEDMKKDIDKHVADEQARQSVPAIDPAPTEFSAGAENPEMDLDSADSAKAFVDTFKELPAPVRPDQRQRVESPADAQRPVSADSPIVAELRARAGQAGTLTAPASKLANIVSELAGTGAYAREGRLPRAAIVSVDTTAAALWSLHVARAGYAEEGEAWAAMQREPWAAEPPAKRIRARLEDLRESIGNLELLVTIGVGCLEVLTWPELDQLAADVQATVAVIEAGEETVWAPREAVKAATPKAVVPGGPPRATGPERDGGLSPAVSAAWLREAVSALARAGTYPEHVDAPGGQRVQLAWFVERGYAEAWGHAEHRGTNVVIELEGSNGERIEANEAGRHRVSLR